ncbi:CRISPR-associated protein Cas4 [Candidatus Woesearchaeota archaeon]|nr:CRISPR-associated protein Cas4 [Candidatus Woesearchaeota archaeon]
MNIIDAMILVTSIILLFLFVLLKSTKVPKPIYKSKTIYSDHKEKPEKALFSYKYGLVGKPDFILHTKDGLLPLEIKHSKRPRQPYFSHVMQLISYCLLIEEVKGIKPKYGFIQYMGGQPFSIPYTKSMKLFLIKTMHEMRHYTNLGDCPKPIKKHKCERCGYKEDCFSRRN